MTDFTYTHAWEEYEDFSSTAVDNLFYNANDRYLVIDWNDYLYRYDDVSLDEARNVADANSVGAAASELKKAKGPGTYLGRFFEVAFDEVAEVVTPAFTNVDNSSTVAPLGETKEFSLQEVPVAGTETADAGGLSVASENYTYELFFDLAGTERSHTIKDAKTLDSALDSLNTAAEALGVPIVVKKAVVTFV